MVNGRILVHCRSQWNIMPTSGWTLNEPVFCGFAIASGRNNICFARVKDGVATWGEEPIDPFDVRYFNEHEEFFYYPTDNSWMCRHVWDNASDQVGAFDEAFLLWGQSATSKTGEFVVRADRGRGIEMHVPKVEDPSLIRCRVYLRQEPELGAIVTDLWRIVGFGGDSN